MTQRYGRTIDEAATFLHGLRESGTPVDAMPEELRPPDLDTAYAVQQRLVDEMLAVHGGRPIGWKIACTNVHAQALLGTDAPVYGRLLSATTHASPAHLPAERFCHRIIEPEFAFVMGADAPASGAPYGRGSIAPLIAEALPAIEVVDYRFATLDRYDARTLAADNALHGAWVHGESISDWRALALDETEVRLLVGDRTVQTGSGARVLGHPLDAMAWLANALAAAGQDLVEGDRVTTGTSTDVYLAEAGNRIVADFGPIGRVELTFTD